MRCSNWRFMVRRRVTAVKRATRPRDVLFFMTNDDDDDDDED